MKQTKQKEIILNAVNELQNHPTADEIYLYLKKDHPRLSLATVYRNLNIYTQEGKIRKVSIPGDSDRFDYALDHHEHFFCESCKKIYDVDLNINGIVHNINPFKVSSYKLMIFGSCDTCLNSIN